MPANLPPEYFTADKRFKEATTSVEKVSALEALIATVPKHKGTDKIRADFRRKLSKLREEAVKRKKKGGRVDLYSIQKEGPSQFALMGFTNSGKSSILNALTNARPVIADYPVSTVMALSGMMPFEDIQFQLVDLPPIGNESTDGWVSSILRAADVLLLVIDLAEKPGVQVERLLEQLSTWNIRTGGADKKAVIILNKKDALIDGQRLERLKQKYQPAYPVVSVSALKNEGLDELKAVLFGVSGIVRVYTKEPGKTADIATPFTMTIGSTVLDLARSVHKDFKTSLKYACIWGSSRFPGQRVQRGYVLQDKDVVELHV